MLPTVIRVKTKEDVSILRSDLKRGTVHLAFLSQPTNQYYIDRAKRVLVAWKNPLGELELNPSVELLKEG